MQQYPLSFEFNKLNEMRSVLMDIDLPRKLYNPRCIMTVLALAGLKEDSFWKTASEQYYSVHDIIHFINNNYPDKANLDKQGYQENSRETFRDETLALFEKAGLVENKPGLSTNSKDNAYRLTAVFAALLRSYNSDRWSDELSAFKETHESYSERLKQIKSLDRGIPVDYQGAHVKLHRDPHNKLQIMILQEFASYFASGSELLYLGDAKDRDLIFKKDKMEELGIDVYTGSAKLPDITLYDKQRKRILFIEAFYSSGEFTLDRVAEIKSLCHCTADTDIVFITAFPNFSKMKKVFESIAWDTEIWIADNPTHMIHKNGDKFIGGHK